MSGYTRRPSTSSVESEDTDGILWKQESSIVKSVPKDLPSDDWPIFELRDAVVFNKDGKSLENALNVVTNGPFIVRGHLYIDDSAQRIHLIKRFRGSAPLEIRHCTLYSIGESDQGRPLVWVSGKGGWYEINPSPAYKSVYNKMCQATTLYYNLMDIYNSRPKKSGKKGKAANRKDELAEVFHQYASRVGDGAIFEDVVERCKEHANFFLCQFTQESPELIDWRLTEFYKWMTSDNASTLKDVEHAIRNPRPHSKTPVDPESRPPRRSTATPGRSLSVEEIEASSFQARPSRSTDIKQASASLPQRSSVPVHSGDDSEADNNSPFATLVAAFEEETDEMLTSKRGATSSGLLNRFYYKYKFPNFRNGTSGCHKIPVEEVIHYNAAELLNTLDKQKYQDTELYPWLKKLAKTDFRPIGLKLSELPYRIQLRGQRAFHARRPGSGLEQGTVSGDGSDGQTTRIGKRPGRPKGTKSSLRPIQSSKKRSHTEIASDAESDNLAGTAAAWYGSGIGQHDGDEAMGGVANADSADESSLSSAESSQDPDQTEQPDTVKLAIRAEKIPSTTPQGHMGTWCCDQEGCDHVIRGNNDDEMQANIQEHFQYHEGHMDRMQLALAESRGLLPISHLLEKIKTIGQRSGTAAGGSDAGSPASPSAPIKRKLVV